MLGGVGRAGVMPALTRLGITAMVGARVVCRFFFQLLEMLDRSISALLDLV